MCEFCGSGEPSYRSVAVLYTGTECIPFGSQLYAVPISALWSMGHGQD